jgi:N-acetylglucosaminyl-diphospho-decaprenol L-rhamnosyltransferase
MSPAERASYEVVVVIYKSRRQLRELIQCIPPQAGLIVVDNSALEEDIRDLLQNRPDTHYIDAGGNLGFSASANLGARASTSAFLIFLNPDTRPSPEVLEALIGQIGEGQPFVSAGPALQNSGGGHANGGGAEPTILRTLIHALGLHRVFPTAGIFFYPPPGRIMEVDWLAGSCLAIRRDAFWEVGGFDPSYFVYNSDIDLGRKLRRGKFRQLLRGDLCVLHEEGASSDAVPPLLTCLRRGRGWRDYLLRNNDFTQARTMLAILTVGFVGRSLLYGVTGQTVLSRQMLAYARGIIIRASG